MYHLKHDNLTATLKKIEDILKGNGFPKGSVSITFQADSVDANIEKLKDDSSKSIPVSTLGFDCHWGGCNGSPGIFCCHF